MYKPTAREAAVLLLSALDEKGRRRGTPLTRARLSRLTLNYLWRREQLNEAWMRDVNEWLLSAGWMVIEASGTYGALKTDVIDHWPRVASMHSKEILDKVARGDFDFSTLEPLFKAPVEAQPITPSSTRPKRSRRRRKPRP